MVYYGARARGRQPAATLAAPADSARPPASSAARRWAMAEDGTVLLFYVYCEIPDPTALVEQQRKLCTSLGLTGRIRISVEGINATLGGTIAACAQYEASLQVRS